MDFSYFYTKISDQVEQMKSTNERKKKIEKKIEIEKHDVLARQICYLIQER